MKKMVICAALLAVCTQGIKADEYNYLTVAYNNIEQSITLSKVQKITFSASEVIVATTEGNVTFPLSQMEKMTFTADPTAIEKLPESSDNLRFENGRLQTGNGILRVYNAGGALIHIANVTEKKGSVDLSTLPAGLYIVSQGKETIKIKK